MEGFGILRDELDIKILILFILGLLPDEIGRDPLFDMASEAGVDYFDFSQCLSELCDTEHVEESGDDYRITAKGLRNGQTLESSLPYTVRAAARRRAEAVADVMRRSASITASHTMGTDGCVVTLALTDGVGEILNLRLLCGDEEQAKKLEKTFRKDAEGVCNSIIRLLSGE